MNSNLTELKSGFKDGFPIGLGYLAVSFTFGIMATGTGLTSGHAVIISLTNVTSAGQFAGLGIMAAGAPFAEMAAAQFIINLRYCLMSCSLSQKFEINLPLFHRLLIGYGVTDEIFGVSVCKPGKISPWYSYGLMSAAVPGWTLGTAAGAISGGLLPERILSALSVALYGMFLAIIIPSAKKDRTLAAVIGISMAASLAFSLLPVLNSLSSGFRLILLTLAVAGGAAFLFPVSDDLEAVYD